MMDKEKKKITVTLSEKATTYFYLRAYSDTKDDGCTPCNQSELISHCLESLKDFEDATDNQLEGWVDDYKKLDSESQKFASNPTKENMFWQVVRAAIKNNKKQ